jgi:hypothetical protein
MKNIIKCKGIDCIKGYSCQRYINPPAANQEYFARVPIIGEHCRFYVPVEFAAVEIPPIKKPVKRAKPSKTKRARVPGVKTGK